MLRTSQSETQLLRSVHGRPWLGLVGWTEEVESSDLILLSKLQDTIKGEKMRTCLPDLGPCGARQVPRDVALVGEGLSPVSGNYHIVSILERSGVIFLENSSTTHPEQRRRQRQCGDSRLSQIKRFIHSTWAHRSSPSPMNIFTKIWTHSLHMDIACTDVGWEEADDDFLKVGRP